MVAITSVPNLSCLRLEPPSLLSLAPLQHSALTGVQKRCWECEAGTTEEIKGASGLVALRMEGPKGGSDYRNTAGISPRRPRTLRITGTHRAEPPRKLRPGWMPDLCPTRWRRLPEVRIAAGADVRTTGLGLGQGRWLRGTWPTAKRPHSTLGGDRALSQGQKGKCRGRHPRLRKG